MIEAASKYHNELPDRQLCCAPIKSQEGREYLRQWPVRPIMPYQPANDNALGERVV